MRLSVNHVVRAQQSTSSSEVLAPEKSHNLSKYSNQLGNTKFGVYAVILSSLWVRVSFPSKDSKLSVDLIFFNVLHSFLETVLS